nr:class I adenylate-forming enzyme family protein [Breoghania sp.]
MVVASLPSGANIPYLGEVFARLGLVPAFVAPSLPSPRLLAIVEDLGARALVRLHMTPDLTASLDLSGMQRSSADFDIALVRTHPAPAVVQPGDLVLMTSGTSSEFPNGCVHSLCALCRNVRRHARAIGLQSHDRVLIKLPLYYSFALVAQALAATQVGASVAIGSVPFSVKEFALELRRNAITVTSLTPKFLQQIVDTPDRILPSTLRTLTVGGDVVPVDTARKLRQRYPELEIYFTYGISEAGPRVTTLNACRADDDALQTLGEPLEETELQIAPDPESPGTGELFIHSDTLLKARIGRNAVDPIRVIDGKRWLMTGDLVSRDEAGRLSITGRRSDFLMSQGEKINLSAIKSFYQTIPGVLEARTRPPPAQNQKPPYALELLVDRSQTAASDPEAVRRELVRNLRRFEQPAHLTITPVDPSQHFVIK